MRHYSIISTGKEICWRINFKKEQTESLSLKEKMKEILNNVQTCVLECLYDMEDLAAMLTKSRTSETRFLQQCQILLL